MEDPDNRFYADEVTRASLGDWSSPIYSDNFWGPGRNGQVPVLLERTRASKSNSKAFLLLSVIFLILALLSW